MDSKDNTFDIYSSSKKLKTMETTKGASLFEIYQGNDQWSAPEFPIVSPSSNHTVLYHIPENVSKNPTIPPVPRQGHDKWDKDHVRMPYSSQNLYPVKDSNGKNILKNRWEMIEYALTQPIRNSKDLHAAILKYNSKFNRRWKFNALHRFFRYLEEEESIYFFENTLPEIIKLALRLPELIPTAIPLLQHNQNQSISISQQQVACLLANAFFCTFPRRNSKTPNAEYSNYPYINFSNLYQQDGSDSVLEKLKCICNYFRRVCRNVPCGVLTFTRRSVEKSKMPNWKESHKYLGSVPLRIDSKGNIEDDGVGLLQVDFANRFLGGGVLNYGCVQEEIRFVVCPELLISMLFTEFLTRGESLLMIGAERFNDYTGYSDSFRWSGNHEDGTIYDSSNRRRCAIVAIDALFFGSAKDQYKPDLIDRELNKAWVGYSIYSTHETGKLTLPAVATGNWGCGAFQGSPYLKSLLQLMACCESHRPILYFTFNDVSLLEEIYDMYNFLRVKNITIGQLYKCLLHYHTKHNSNDQLYPFIRQQLRDVEKGEPNTEHVSRLPKNEPEETQSSNSTMFVITPNEDSQNVSEDGNESEELITSLDNNESIEKSSFFDIMAKSEHPDQSAPKPSRSTLQYFESIQDPVDTESICSCSVVDETVKNLPEEPNTKPESTLLSKISSGKITSYFQRVKKD